MELRKNLKGVNNHRGLGLIFVVEIKMVNILRVADLKHRTNHILSVEQWVLQEECLILKRNPHVLKKEEQRKKDTQTGRGQKPVMTSYKTKKEGLERLIKKVLKESIKSS